VVKWGGNRAPCKGGGGVESVWQMGRFGVARQINRKGVEGTCWGAK